MVREIRLPPDKERDKSWKGTVVEMAEWAKKEGEFIQEGDLVLTVESGKGDWDLESPVSGVLLKVLVQEGIEFSLPCVVGLMGDSVEDVNSPEFAEELKKLDRSKR